MEILGVCLAYLVTAYRNRGFNVAANATEPVTFVGDTVLANIHYKIGWKIDRPMLRDTMNDKCGDFVASFEPLIRDVSTQRGVYYSSIIIIDTPLSICQCETLRRPSTPQRRCSVSHVDLQRRI